ncbi:MAG: DUF664 domain-containing protein [Thermodesulfobacteriota bacterium]|nr:DUF664 domain-containing protein [Thermodesulfobacteriota bacterium]
MLKEIENYLSFLDDLRSQVKSLLEGLPKEALDWRPIDGQGEMATNSLTVMAIHLAGSEAFWMKEIIGGQSIHRDRDAEFVVKGLGFPELIAKLETAAKETPAILSSLTPAQLEETRKFRDRIVTVRWAILHVIEHFAMHVGHMQLTRQLWLANFGKK